MRKFFSLVLLLLVSVFLKGMLPGVSDTIIHLPEVMVSSEIIKGKLKNITGSIAIVPVEPNSPSFVSVLNEVPGVFIQNGAVNTNRTTIRGIGSRTPYGTNRIRVYLNDIPLTSGDGFTSVEQLDINSLGRIEVVKGPSSALYGSGLGGSIKATTTAFDTTQWLGYRAGSFGSGHISAKLAGCTQKGNIQFHFNEQWSDGFRQNSRFSKSNLLLNGQVRFENSTIELTAMFHKMNAEIASSLNKEMFMNNSNAAAPNWLAVKGYEATTRLLAGITYRQRISNSLSNKAILYGSVSDAFERRPFNDLDDDSKILGLRDVFLYHSEKFDFTLGGEFYNEWSNWKLSLNEGDTISILLNRNGEQRTTLNLFGFFRFRPFPKVIISGGVNANTLQYTLIDKFLDDGDQAGRFSEPLILSPRFGINVEPFKTTVLYGSIGHGFSPPTVEESLLPEGAVNLNLKPEQGWMWEMGTRVFSSQKSYYTEVILYGINLNNLLVTKRISEELFTGINAGKTNHIGVEWFQKIRLFSQNKWPGKASFTSSFTSSYNRFVDFIDDGTDYSGNLLPGIPDFILDTRLKWEPINTGNITFGGQWIGSQYMNDANNERYNGHLIFEVSIENHFEIFRNIGMTLEAGIKNLADTHHASMILINAPSFGGNAPRYYYPGVPRNFYFDVRIVL